MPEINLKIIITQEKDVICKQTEEGGILLDLKTGNYFIVSKIGFFIWRMLNKPKALEKIMPKVISRYSVKKTKAFSDIVKFIKILYAKKLISLASVK